MTLFLVYVGGAFLRNHAMLYLFKNRLTGTEAGGMRFHYEEQLWKGKAITGVIYPSEVKYASIHSGEGIAYIIADHSPYWRYGIARLPSAKLKFGKWHFSPHLSGLDGYASYWRIQGDYFGFTLVVLH